MKIQELRQKSEMELQRLLQEKRERLRSLRFDLVSGKVKNVREIRETRKVIARILTLLKPKTKNEPARNATPARHADASHAGWHSVAGGKPKTKT